MDQFYLGLIFILFYSFPVLCSAIGSKHLDSLSEKRSTVNQSYLASLTNFIGGNQQIRHYQGQDFFFTRYQKQLQTSLDTEINYEKQRTLNSLLINSIDAFCSVTPIVIGGFMTYYNYLDAASFVAIYLVSYNIGYQFQELAYFTNTRKATRTLLNKYQKLLGQSDAILPRIIENIFPIQLDSISLEKMGISSYLRFPYTSSKEKKLPLSGKVALVRQPCSISFMEKRHQQVVRLALLVKTCHVKKSQALVPISSKIAITLTRYLWTTISF